MHALKGNPALNSPEQHQMVVVLLSALKADRTLRSSVERRGGKKSLSEQTWCVQGAIPAH